MAITFSGYTGRVEISGIPDRCPICHHGIGPRYMNIAYAALDPAGRFAEILFQCPRHACQHLFLARYYDKYSYGSYDLIECVPKTLQTSAFSERIQKVSPV